MISGPSPNFFIIGAPKCGTTTISDWLRSHPSVFMPDSKEPHHFNKDLKFVVYPGFDDYMRLFAGAGTSSAIGEASVLYLYSDVAVPAIEAAFGNPRYIVCLRNPVEMAYSLFREHRFQTSEDLSDFNDAWALSPQRRQGLAVSRWCREPLLLDYQSVCRLGSQVERLLARVPRERVHFVFLEDLQRRPAFVYESLLGFLRLVHDGRSEFPTSNAAKTVRWPGIKRAVRMAGAIRRLIPIRTEFQLLNKLNAINKTGEKEEAPLSAAIRNEMADYFRDDVRLLSTLVSRDLSAWCARVDAGGKPVTCDAS